LYGSCALSTTSLASRVAFLKSNLWPQSKFRMMVLIVLYSSTGASEDLATILVFASTTLC
jgi:hypothetical protein